MAASNNPYKQYVPSAKAASPAPVAAHPLSPSTPTSNPYFAAANNLNTTSTRQPTLIRTSSIISELGIYLPSVTSSIEAPSHDPMALTPLRAHYLKRELVTLGFASELKAFGSPSAVSLLGHPFLPESRFKNGVPLPEPKPASMEALSLKNKTEQETVDLPFLRFVFHQFVLTFPFLAKCPPTFFSHKLQPFVHSFVSRNISGSDERAEVTSRRKVQNKIEKHLGLIMSAAIKLAENDGKEEVVRIEDDGSMQTAVPASQAPKFGTPSKANKVQALAKPPPEAAFSINIVSVRNSVVKGRVRNKSHEEFIIRTRQKGHKDVYVARRYGDFVRLADTMLTNRYGSVFFLQLRIECIEQDVASPPNKDRRKTEMKPGGGGGTPPSNNSPRQSIDESSSAHMSAPVKLRNIPSLARERNRLTLRAYLRSLLNNPVLAATGAFQSFLVESPIELSPMEMRDVELREEMDRIREEEARSFRSEVDERVAELEAYLRTFREHLVQSDGLSRVFATIRRTEKVENLPVEYRKVLEWARISLASTIYQLFLGSDNSSSIFTQLKRIHGMMPYFMLRGILKISNPVAMVRAVLDLFLARPFGSNSLLQKMFSSGLNDEVRELKDDATLVAHKIDDEVLCDKVEGFVDASKEYQDRCRAEAKGENIDLMSVILRSDQEPRMDATTFERVQRASVAYEEYKHERDQLTDPDEDEGPDNDDAWLFEDLHVLLRILTKARDKEQLIELIFEGSTSELLKDIVTIFYEPLAKVYKAANIADSLSDLQTFLNDLIKTVEFAEDANLTDPQQTVQIFVDLVGRHEARFYHFVHQVHSKGEGLFDNLMKYIELFINFVRDGLPSAISLEALLPAGGQERQAMMAEVDSIVAYHHQLKKAHHDRLRKRMLKGKETEADADAAFVTGVMENLHLGGMMGDVADVTAEASDEEDFEDGGNATSEDEDEPRRPIELALAAPPRSNNPYKTAMLERIPIKNPGKRKRRPIQPPELKLVPALVPIFVEMVRPELQAARRKTKAALGV
ncbi:BZ3500_MvSof-1268-A1-R1_Chr10-3g03075 [Microbotryum saponariae]|uniref:BZ3500_MvSof-1268-A1-R1_Chr10-3g03075 protein n=1 Tax=Microbotryum saponariae TaxID=289078 RepID=A0A2X0N4Q3_9BASI|nr:BZ3501_MvSof-1269-A2-R1_Chr10-2g02653 [Microbotryum saponariae]SDA02102.1 BZ3500_MvSof-1268-A1-R1_Chr10-3g03075 [Microbotryum saponariae]